MSKIIGVICTKGGVGKTTMTANIGAVLADMGQRVLLVDADPQQSLSRLYQVTKEAAYKLTQLYRTANPAQCISKTVIKGLDIVLNDDRKGDGIIPAFLRESFTHIQYLRAALATLEDAYDYILIDTQGSTGMIQESVVFAADVLLSPIQPKVIDAREFIFGTVDLVNKFKPLQGHISVTGRPFPPLRTLINMWDRTLDTAEISRLLRSQFDRQTDGIVTVLDTIIPRLNIYSASAGMGVPVHRAEVVRRGTTISAYEAMVALVHELEPKLCDIQPTWSDDAPSHKVVTSDIAVASVMEGGDL